MDISNISIPPQRLPFSKKNKAWRKKHLDWALSKSYFHWEPCRKSVKNKKINYDLYNGVLHMSDLEAMINPENIQGGFVPDNIQHYAIMNSKLQILTGEESDRAFDFRVIVTNPNAISEIENNKKEEVYQRLQQMVMNTAQSEDEFNAELEKMGDYFTYEWQDMREVRANALLNHYIKEQDLHLLFHKGFYDALIVGEEIYQCDIVGGEPVVRKLDPMKLHVFKTGYSSNIEDADMIIYEDYLSPGQIRDEFYDVLTTKDLKYIDELPDHVGHSAVDNMANIDERFGFINTAMMDDIINKGDFFWDPNKDNPAMSQLPYDMAGNVRVLRMYWKSERKIKKVKSYDPETGEEVYNIYPETYIINEDEGEEEQIYWINEAWEGTLIGEEVYVNMRPRVVQYNRLSNPSRCHFGIIGSIYNLNDEKPFSMVDVMKPYAYLYDVIHDRLNKAIARNWGMLVRLDLAKVPRGWTVDKWFYYAKSMGLAIEDSFKEGNIGAATGKLAGGLNNASNGVIAASDGNIIQQYINLLEYINQELHEVSGISKQREGQISNRETVGGVERATLQSSHITEWLFVQHENIKKRVLECVLETAKIALQGGSKKFQYLLSDGSMTVMNIDGDEFAEADYGLLVDNGRGTQELFQSMTSLGQAALQNQILNFSTLMKLYSSCSIAEKQRLVEKDEQKKLAEAQQQQQMQQQQFEQQLQQQAQIAEQQQQMQIQMHQEDNETKILVAQINSKAEADRLALMNKDFEEGKEMTVKEKEELAQRIREFDAKIKQDADKLKLDRDKFEYDKIKTKKDQELKQKQINKSSNKSK